MDTTLASLRKIPLFEQLDDDDLDEIASHLIERRFPRNATVMEEGLTGDYMYVIGEGRVKVTKLSEDGREKILEMLGEGAFVGEMALLDQGPRSATVKTLVPTVLLALSRHDFLALLRNNSDLALHVIQELTRRLRETDEQASSLSFLRVKDRTKGLLHRLAEAPEGELRRTPTLTHQQIAEMIGTSRETVTRVVKELKQDGWLGQEGKQYLVLAEV
jgi:CRP/FNR family cyclic AMP-dependent transcriptional regulator